MEFSYDPELTYEPKLTETTTPRGSRTQIGSGRLHVPKVWPNGMPGIQIVKTRRRRRARKIDDPLEATRALLKECRAAGLTYEQTCKRLGDLPRPPRATWRDLSWPKAYSQHSSAVMKWMSLEASK